MYSCVYYYKYYFILQCVQLNDVEIKEAVGGEDKSWGLWHEHRGSIRRYTFQAYSALIKVSWLKDLKEQQQRSSLLTTSQSSSRLLQHVLLYS